MFKRLREDIRTIKERDPAARNAVEIFFMYSGLHAIWWYRASHWCYCHKMLGLARFLSQSGRFWTGIEIHPGAKIGKGLFIDHGMGVVIGETTEIGDNVTIYQGVTLGGTGKDIGKRHPTIGNNVLIGSGAKVLGPFKVGDNSKIAANAVVLSEIPPNSTCVGVPARVVKIGEKRVCPEDLDQIHIPDPISMELCRLTARLDKLEKKLKDEQTQKEEIL
ncbi:MAG: serine O-acetyltransferase [Clostridia bacterium]|nr:serine O-acetyltransferase [Clostridia bacterium]